MNLFGKRPLQATLIALFTSLFLVFGLIVVSVNFKFSLDLAKNNLEQTMNVIGDFSAVSLKSMFSPVEIDIDLAEQQIAEGLSGLQRHELSPIMTDFLKRHNSTTAVYIGWADGDFMIYRHANRIRYNISHPMTEYIVQRVERENNEITLQALFELDSQGRVLKEQKSDYSLDPRTRQWFKSASETNGIIHTDPYAYFTENILGITLAKQSKDFVIGVDISLEHISRELQSINYFKTADYFLIDQHNNVISSNNSDVLSELIKLDQPKLANLAMPRYSASQLQSLNQESVIYDAGGESWYASNKLIETESDKFYFLVSIVNSNEIFKASYYQLYTSSGIGLFIIFLALIAVWFVSRKLSSSIELLSEDAAHLAGFDFSTEINLESPISEVGILAASLFRLQKTIRSFSNISLKTQNSFSYQDLNDSLLRESSQALETRYGFLYRYDTRNSTYQLTSEIDRSQQPSEPLSKTSWSSIDLSTLEKLYEKKSELEGMKHVLAVALKNSPLNKIVSDNEFPNLRSHSRCLLMPLHTKDGTPLGLIALISESVEKLDNNQVSFGNVFAQFANSALENHQLYKQQKDLLNSFIQLIAGAIDTKSPYTGGHCERVPELTQMLVAKAEESSTVDFKDFGLNENDWEAIRIASWLHDCGKVTTPEFVVDKATKLETIANRIHDIRSRFELLKQYEVTQFYKAQIESLESNGHKVSDNELAKLQATMDRNLATLDEEFGFVASCNVGSEYMSDNRKQRLSDIAQRTWVRTLDNRIGLSWVELERMPDSKESLPAVENLLANKPEHKIVRKEGNRFSEGNAWNIKMDVPELLYDRGELYNLQIEKGTLTSEERFKINEHIIQTIIMLEQLPFPAQLSAIPEIATGHHERMDGNGYPRKLIASEMSLPSLAMVIADIFEALTANDRPYKRAKTLSESLHIMLTMMCDNHLDPALFELFIDQEVYVEYGNKFLSAEQNQFVDKENILKSIRDYRKSL